MATIQVHDILPDSVLVSRESARLLEDSITELISAAMTNEVDVIPNSISIDFRGVDGVAPSFIDELIRVLESVLTKERGNGHDWRLIVENPPNRLSSKFEAIARSHGMSVHEQPNGSWIFSNLPSDQCMSRTGCPVR